MKKYIAIALVALIVIAAFWLFESDFDTAEVDAKYSNQASQFFTTADNARVHFRDQGNPQGSPLVLVHGSNASLHTWEPWIKILGATFRVITLDLPGHGLTGAVPSNRYDSSAQIETLAALTQHLDINRFALGGNSMGGGVTWRYALEHPDQVSAMVLVNASGLRAWREQTSSAPETSEQAPKRDRGPLAFRLLRKPWFRSIAVHLDTKFLTTQGLRAAFDDTSKVTDAMIELYYNMSMRAGTRAATLARFASFGPTHSSAVKTEADLATLKMPALILWGETDAVIPVEHANRFAQVLPNHKLIIYPEVGHLPMEEIAQRSGTDALNFLQAQLNP